MGWVTVTLLILGVIIAYACAGSFLGVVHDRKSRIKCQGSPEANWCVKGRWCGHVACSVWLAGIFWPVGIPVLTAMGAGKTVGGPTRRERRHERELEDAKHRVEVARLIEEENTILDRQIRQNARP